LRKAIIFFEAYFVKVLENKHAIKFLSLNNSNKLSKLKDIFYQKLRSLGAKF